MDASNYSLRIALNTDATLLDGSSETLTLLPT